MCVDEGIDEFAEFCGAGKAVAEWTSRLSFLLYSEGTYGVCGLDADIKFCISFRRAMNGSVTFQEALAARLSLINPTLALLQDYLEKRPPR